MLFHTTREAFNYAQRIRKEKEKDIVVFGTKTAFGVCFENEFFEKGIKYTNIICYLAHPKYENRIMSIRESDEKLKRKIMNEKRSNQILEKVSNMKKYNAETQRAQRIEAERRKKIMKK